MTENKEILKNLIGDEENSFILDENSDENKDSLSSASRIVHLRYRFYATGIIILIVFILFKLLIPKLDSFKAEKANVENAKLKLLSVDAREQEYNDSIGLLETIQNFEKDIVACVNQEEGCQELPKEIKDNFAVTRSYLLTYDLNDEKMDVDERKIIENIDTILLKEDFLSNNTAVNGTLTKISIGDKTLEEGLYIVPVQLNITFENKEALLSFINNVERYVPEDESMRVLYKIDKITYDIVNSDESQDTVIYMNLYYYEDEE